MNRENDCFMKKLQFQFNDVVIPLTMENFTFTSRFAVSERKLTTCMIRAREILYTGCSSFNSNDVIINNLFVNRQTQTRDISL